MKPTEKRYKFEAIVRDATTAHDCTISVVSTDDLAAWAKASDHCIEYARLLGAVLVAVSLIGVGEPDISVPFDPPYTVDSPLWTLEFAHRN